MDTVFDEKLKEIKDRNWLPWVGKNYLSLDEHNRLLIIGESHYQDETENSIKKHKEIEFTRDVIEDLAINRNYGTTKIFQNLHKALFRNDKFESSDFWNLISFYNFIQVPMKSNKKRPSVEDINTAWCVFFNLIRLLKPQTCLFIGTSSADFMMQNISKSKYTIKDNLIWESKISNAYPKSATIIDENNNEIKLIFIRHTSQMFSWSSWNNYLKSKIPNELAWLEQMIANK